MNMATGLHTRRDFLKTVGLATTAMAFRTWPSLAEPGVLGRPNMVIALCDDLGYGDLGCFGSVSVLLDDCEGFFNNRVNNVGEGREGEIIEHCPESKITRVR